MKRSMVLAIIFAGMISCASVQLAALESGKVKDKGLISAFSRMLFYSSDEQEREFSDQLTAQELLFPDSYQALSATEQRMVILMAGILLVLGVTIIYLAIRSFVSPF